MQKCPNCGQTTTRTEDWSCRWCGHPLLSSSYQKIEKSYKQLKEDVIYKQKSEVSEDIAVVPLPAEEALPPTRTPEPETKPVPEPETKPLIEYEPIYVPKVKPEAELKPEPKPEPEPEIEPKLEEEPELKPELELEEEPELEPELELEEEPELEPELEPEEVLEVEPEVELEPAPKIITQPTTAGLKVTVEELLSAYEEDGVAAGSKFFNKALKITGAVGRVEVKENLDIYYITLTSGERTGLQAVRCVFDKKYDDELNQLVPGQIVTVQGTYDGSIIDMRMRDCVLVD